MKEFFHNITGYIDLKLTPKPIIADIISRSTSPSDYYPKNRFIYRVAPVTKYGIGKLSDAFACKIRLDVNQVDVVILVDDKKNRIAGFNVYRASEFSHTTFVGRVAKQGEATHYFENPFAMQPKEKMIALDLSRSLCD